MNHRSIKSDHKLKLRILSVFLLLALALLCFLNIFFGFFRFPFIGIDPFEVVPGHSLMVIEYRPDNNLQDSTSNLPPAWNSLRQAPVFENLNDYRNRLTPGVDTIAQAKTGNFLAALQMSSAGNFDFLYIFKKHDAPFKKAALDNLKAERIRTSTYLDETVYEIIFRDQQRIAVSFYKNLVLLAPFPFMVEDAIAQLKHPQERKYHKFFHSLKKTGNENAGISVYLNLSEMAKTFNVDGSIPLLRQSADENQQKHQDRWLALNFVQGTDTFFMEGSMIAEDFAENDRGSVEAIESEIFAVIPDNCSFLHWRAINNVPIGEADSIFTKFVQTWVAGEAALFLTELQGADTNEGLFLVLKSKESELTTRTMEAYAEASGKLQEWDYQTFTIRQLLSDDILQSVPAFEKISMQNPFYTLVGNYVVFSSSRQRLEILIDKHILGQTLSNNADFLNFKAQWKPGNRSLFYSNVPLFAPWLRQIIMPSPDNDEFQPFFDLLQHFTSVGFQQIRSGKYDRLHVYTGLTDEPASATRLIWNARLAANARIAPVVLKNAKNGQYEIFVQDAENKIYLFDRKGQLIWDRQLKAPVISKIHEIQYYPGDENHILFNTKDQLWLIDHSGLDVGIFPLSLPSPASNGVCVVDFEGNRNYGFFIGAQNGNVYGFKRTGEPIAGWNPNADAGKLVHDLQHFQLEGSDYFMALNESGDFNVFKRNGDKHFETVAFNERFPSPPEFQVTERNARMVLTNDSGKVHVFNKSGKHFNLNAGAGSNQNVKFLFADVTGDGRKDYISLSERDMCCYFYEDSKFKKAFCHKFENSQDEVFEVRIAGSQKSLIGTLNKTNKRISLFQPDGRVAKGFPLAATTAFSVVDLYGADKPVLITALDNSIYATRLD